MISSEQELLLPENSVVEEGLGYPATRARSFQRFAKNAVDFFGATALILLLLPVFLIVALVILFESGWPIIYRRRVIGAKGEFDAFKFRSMKPGADTLLDADPLLRAEFERNYKLKNDPRLTRVGPFLRRSSLDELPQLFNVLMGQMSLVGPRMKSPPEMQKYKDYKSLLLTVKPGITGYWQVHGRQSIPYEERVKMDVYYIENWSLAMDLKIILQTPLKVLRKEGAY